MRYETLVAWRSLLTSHFSLLLLSSPTSHFSLLISRVRNSLFKVHRTSNRPGGIELVLAQRLPK